RAWDTLYLQASPWVDPGGNALEGDVAYTFSADGKPVAAGTNPRTLPLSRGPAEYRLELTASATQSWWRTSTAATTTWTLRSARPDDAGPQNVPLMLLDYDLDADLTNTADRHDSPEVIGLRAHHQSGSDG